MNDTELDNLLSQWDSETAGLVLLDSSHEEQVLRFLEIDPKWPALNETRVAPLGLSAKRPAGAVPLRRGTGALERGIGRQDVSNWIQGHQSDVLPAPTADADRGNDRDADRGNIRADVERRSLPGRADRGSFSTQKGKIRYVPMTQELAGEIHRYPRELGQDRIFPPKSGAKGERQRVEGSFETVLDAAGIKEFRFHDLRHTFASWYMMNGGDLYELA